MAESFSQIVKNQLAAAELRKKCCRHTSADMEALAGILPDTEGLRKLWERCRCGGCRAVFFREIFRLCGSVTDPRKSYQLDFSLEDPSAAALLRTLTQSGGTQRGCELLGAGHVLRTQAAAG